MSVVAVDRTGWMLGEFMEDRELGTFSIAEMLGVEEFEVCAILSGYGIVDDYLGDRLESITGINKQEWINGGKND